LLDMMEDSRPNAEWLRVGGAESGTAILLFLGFPSGFRDGEGIVKDVVEDCEIIVEPDELLCAESTKVSH